MSSRMTLKEINNLTPNEFHKIFINVIERWPEAAIFVSALSPFGSVDSLLMAFERYIEKLALEAKITILRLHPDLAGKAAEELEITDDSKFEQKSVGLNTMSSDQKRNLGELNDQYKEKFGFPFIICVRENKLETIFKEMSRRVNNTEMEEIETGINEVKKICRLRILQIVDDAKTV